MRILFVAYFFPPYAHATAVERTVMLIKGLAEMGHDIGLVTARNYTFFSRDYSFLKYVPETLKIINPSALEPSTFLERVSNSASSGRGVLRKFIWPDSRILWLMNAIPAAYRFTQRFVPDVIVSVAPPYTDLLLGYFLSKKFKVPHIVDLLDPWSDDLYEMYKMWWQKELTSLAEKEILKNAKGVVVATYPMKWRLIEKYSFLKPETVENITFGIREDLSEKVAEVNYTAPFTVLYLGTLRGGHKNPVGFVEAFAEFAATHPEVRLRIAGNIDQEVMSFIGNRIPESNVQITGYVKNEDIPLLVNDAHILWLLISRAPGFELVMPAKTISYMGFKRPILATVPEGWTAEFLRKMGATVVEYENKGEILKALESLYDEYKSRGLRALNNNITEEFKYSVITQKYERFLKTLV